MTARRWILTAAITLTAVAFLGSLGHVYATVNAHDGNAPQVMTAGISLMPEVTVALVTVKLLREGPRQMVAWLVGATSLVFTVLANLSQREAGPWGFVVAVWPAWTSVGAMLLVHSRQQMSKHDRAEQAVTDQRVAAEDTRRAAAAQEEANRLEAARQQMHRDQLKQRERELAEQVEARKAEERDQRRRERGDRPAITKSTKDHPNDVDSLEPVVWEIANERIAAGLGRIVRDTPRSGTPLGLKDELKARGYPGVGNARAGALLKKVYGDVEVTS